MNGPNRDPRHDGPERMLGGYATENLSEQEKQELFSAALQDQQLFDALMEEESLRDLLHRPGAKAELLDALQPQQTPLSRFRRWLATPMAWGTAGAVAAAAILIVMLLPRTPDSRPSAQVARQEAVTMGAPKESPAPSAPAAAPAPKQANEARQMASARKIEAEPRREAPPQPDRQSFADSAPPPTAQPTAQQLAQQQVQPQVQQQTQQQVSEPQALRQDRQTQVQAPPPAAIAEQGPPPAPQMAATAPPAPRPPLEYVLLKRNEQGAYSPATSFRDSDAVRIQVTAHESGYMALTRQGESKPLVTAQPVRPGQTVQLPPSGFLLPSSRPYRLEFTRQPLPPGRIIGGFRAGSSSGETKQELSKTKDADAPQPLVIEILIPGNTN